MTAQTSTIVVYSNTTTVRIESVQNTYITVQNTATATVRLNN